MTEIDKLIARMGYQLVQLDLALQQANARIKELEEAIKTADAARPMAKLS